MSLAGNAVLAVLAIVIGAGIAMALTALNAGPEWVAIVIVVGFAGYIALGIYDYYSH